MLYVNILFINCYRVYLAHINNNNKSLKVKLIAHCNKLIIRDKGAFQFQFISLCFLSFCLKR